jgi:hypothetical protein
VRALLARAGRYLSSLALSCTLLVLLMLLTWLGTLEQVHTGLYEVQKKYFESFFLTHDVGGVPIPLPGANLVLCVLFVNLIAGGMVRIRKSRATAGIFVAHCGIALLLVSGFIKTYFSEEGHVTLYPGQTASEFQSHHRWEVAIARELGHGQLEEHLVQEELFLDATGSTPVRLDAPALPFDLEVRHFMHDARPLPKGPMFDVEVPVIDGVFLRDQERHTENERNLAGLYVTVVDRHGGRTEGLLWGVATAPWTVTVDGEDWAIDLRRERYPMPFTLGLDEFKKDEHPGTSMPSSFSSDVSVTTGDTSRPVLISMNEPLREDGLVLYQASWGPRNARPGERLFSTLAVVRNPADRYPIYGCIVIALGLALHFSRRLARHVRIQLAEKQVARA